VAATEAKRTAKEAEHTAAMVAKTEEHSEAVQAKEAEHALSVEQQQVQHAEAVQEKAAEHQLATSQLTTSLDVEHAVALQTAMQAQEAAASAALADAHIEVMEAMEEKDAEYVAATAVASAEHAEEVTKQQAAHTQVVEMKEAEHAEEVAKQNAAHSQAITNMGADHLIALTTAVKAAVDALKAETEQASQEAMASKEAEHAAALQAAMEAQDAAASIALAEAALRKDVEHAEEVAKLRIAHSEALARKEADLRRDITSKEKKAKKKEFDLRDKVRLVRAKQAQDYADVLAAKEAEAAVRLERAVQAKDAVHACEVAKQQTAHLEALTKKEAAHEEQVAKQQAVHTNTVTRIRRDSTAALMNAVQAKEAEHAEEVARQHAAHIKTVTRLRRDSLCNEAAAAAALVSATQAKDALAKKEADAAVLVTRLRRDSTCKERDAAVALASVARTKEALAKKGAGFKRLQENEKQYAAALVANEAEHEQALAKLTAEHASVAEAKAAEHAAAVTAELEAEHADALEAIETAHEKALQAKEANHTAELAKQQAAHVEVVEAVEGLSDALEAKEAEHMEAVQMLKDTHEHALKMHTRKMLKDAYQEGMQAGLQGKEKEHEEAAAESATSYAAKLDADTLNSTTQLLDEVVVENEAAAEASEARHLEAMGDYEELMSKERAEHLVAMQAKEREHAKAMKAKEGEHLALVETEVAKQVALLRAADADTARHSVVKTNAKGKRAGSNGSNGSNDRPDDAAVTGLKVLQLKNLLKYKGLSSAGVSDKKALQELVSAHATAAEVDAAATGMLGKEDGGNGSRGSGTDDGQREEQQQAGVASTPASPSKLYSGNMALSLSEDGSGEEISEDGYSSEELELDEQAEQEAAAAAEAAAANAAKEHAESIAKRNKEKAKILSEISELVSAGVISVDRAEELRARVRGADVMSSPTGREGREGKPAIPHQLGTAGVEGAEDGEEAKEEEEKEEEAIMSGYREVRSSVEELMAPEEKEWYATMFAHELDELASTEQTADRALKAAMEHQRFVDKMRTVHEEAMEAMEAKVQEHEQEHAAALEVALAAQAAEHEEEVQEIVAEHAALLNKKEAKVAAQLVALYGMDAAAAVEVVVQAKETEHEEMLSKVQAEHEVALEATARRQSAVVDAIVAEQLVVLQTEEILAQVRQSELIRDARRASSTTKLPRARAMLGLWAKKDPTPITRPRTHSAPAHLRFDALLKEMPTSASRKTATSPPWRATWKKSKASTKARDVGSGSS
jgi:hypothetical protein